MITKQFGQRLPRRGAGPKRFQIQGESELPPNHLIHHAHIGLDDLHDFRRDILVHIVRNGNPVVTCSVHGDGSVHCLEEALFINAGEDKAGLI